MAKLGIITGIVPDDGLGDSLLDGAIKINSNFDEIYTYFGDGTNLTFSSGTPSQWSSTLAGIHTVSNVGIGTTNSRFVLEVGSVGASGTSLWVNGNARVTGILTIGTSSIVLNGSSNKINVGSGVTIDGSTGIIQASSVVVNGATITGSAVTSITAGPGISINQSTGNVTITATGGGGGESYWVSTTAGIHTLSNVGIGTTNPTSALTVRGNVIVSGVSTFNNTATFTSQATGGIGVNLPTTQRASFGTINEMTIWSSGTYLGRSTNYIDATDGDIYFRNKKTIIRNSEGTTERIIAIFDGDTFNNENVTLHYGGNQKFQTTGVGVTVYGTTQTQQLSVSGVSTFTNNINLNSGNLKVATDGIIKVGNSDDLEIYYNGSTGQTIKSTGDLRLLTSRLLLNNAANTEQLIEANQNGSVALFYDNLKELETTGYGVTIYGTTQTQQLSVSGVSTFIDGVGIGTTNATDKLTVRGGDISVGINTSQGLILTSANGTKYRLFVEDDGTLKTTAV